MKNVLSTLMLVGLMSMPAAAFAEGYGGGTDIDVGASSSSSATAIAGASSVNTMNVEGTAIAPGISAGGCIEGGGIGVVGFSIGAAMINHDCMVATKVTEAFRAGMLSKSVADKIWLNAMGFTTEGSKGGTSVSTSGRSTSPQPKATPQAAGSLMVTVAGKSYNLTGNQLALYNACKPMRFGSADGPLAQKAGCN